MCLGFEYVSLNERRVVVLRYVEKNRIIGWKSPD